MTLAQQESLSSSPAGALPPVAGPAARRVKHWAALPVILTGTFMVTLDFFIVNVAIPQTQMELGASSAAIQWMISAYGLAFAACLIIGGRLGDLFGRRRIFVAGMALFMLASLICGIAPDALVLVAGRVLQGIGASLLAPQVLAIMGTLYTGPDRLRAFTWYGIVLGLGAVGGQMIGGLLIEADPAGLGWRSCYLVNLPVGAIALVCSFALIPPMRMPQSQNGHGGRLDLPGAALITLAVAAVILPLIEGRERGWPDWTFACLMAALPLLLLFAHRQRRLAASGRLPLVDPRLFRERGFTIGLVTVLAFYAGNASFYLVLALYLQQGRGLAAFDAGAVFSIMGLSFSVVSFYAGRLAARWGRQSLALGALLLIIGQFLLIATVRWLEASHAIAWLAPALLIDGAGIGMVMAPLVSTALKHVSPAYAGAASGVLTSVQQLGNAGGVAIIGLIFYGWLGDAASDAAYAEALVASLLYLIALAAAVMLLLQFFPRRDVTGS